MKPPVWRIRPGIAAHSILGILLLAVAGATAAPVPLLRSDHPVDWWFVFKFNAHSFPGCSGNVQRTCSFGGTPQPYRSGFSQQFVYASNENPILRKGEGCLGETPVDPLGATFEQVYERDDYFYLIWNDQFYANPKITGCEKDCGAPWGHSKGMLAWNGAGEGFVLQVTTPSWPAAGNRHIPRSNDGNTLGCVHDDNVEVSQHFFAVRLDRDDLIAVLEALRNVGIATDPQNPQIVKNGGPSAIQNRVNALGRRSTGTEVVRSELSSGVEILAKPPHLHVPPWQLVSAELDGIPLKTATWWTVPEIPATDESTRIDCWNDELDKPGAVAIATSGHWEHQPFALTGGQGPNHNHAKIGLSLDPASPYAIFGDMNQQGSLTPASGHPCTSSQNGRGGMFYIINNPDLTKSLAELLNGETASVEK